VESNYEILGLTCLSCAANAEQALAGVQGVARSKVYFASQKVALTLDGSTPPTFEHLADAVGRLGFKLVAPGHSIAQANAEHLRRLRVSVVWACAVAVVLLVLHVVAPHAGWSVVLQAAGALTISLGPARGYFVRAIHQLRTWAWGMDTMVALAATVCLVASLPVVLGLSVGLHHTYFTDAAFLLALVLLGNWLEETAKQTANQKLQTTSDEAAIAYDVWNLDTQSWVSLPADELHAGMRVRLRPGQRLTFDGVVLSGETTVNESWLTGEPWPVTKQVNDTLNAGTANQTATVEARVTRVGPQTTFARLHKQIIETQNGRLAGQRLADRLAGSLIPALFAVAVAAGLGWWWATGQGDRALETFITVMVVSCPCALGLATPVALKLAVERAWNLGVAVRETRALEDLATLTDVALDKTGTLTVGEPTIRQVNWSPTTVDEQNALAQAVCQAAGASQHPLSKTIARTLAAEYGFTLQADLQIRETPGLGLRARIPSNTPGEPAQEVWLGKAEWVTKVLPAGQSLPSEASAQLLPTDSLVYAVVNGRWVATFYLTDPLHPAARPLVQEFHTLGLSVVMLSGDRQATAQAVAEPLGITAVYAEQSPEAKAEYLRAAQQQGKRMLMIGDGLNDALALATAQVGLSMPNAAVLATSSAPLALLKPELLAIPAVVRLARRTRRIIYQNIGWALSYNVLALPLAVGLVPGFHLTPPIAAACMVGSTLAVWLNSLRVRKA
jgi:Cu2+-exporting ATPase